MAGLTRSKGAWALLGMQLVVAGQALYGGISLINDTWQLPDEWLAGTPFTDWVGPGWALIVLVGVPQLLAAIAIMVGSRLAILGGVLAGAGLLLWIGIQLAVLQQYFFLQPVIAVIGVAEIGLALWWRHKLARPAPTS